MRPDGSRWRELSRDAIAAAGLCMRQERYRSSVSRAYYAVFSMAMAKLLKAGMKLPTGRSTWKHRELPARIRTVAGIDMPVYRVADLIRNLRACYAMRIDADYVPGRTVDRATAKAALRQAMAVLNILGDANE